MARPIYSYELEDPDFCWLISKYRETHPGCQSVESTCLPVVLICPEEERVDDTAGNKLPIAELDHDRKFDENSRNK